ncbi:uncharacterized protein LOC143301375 [Babylonia areolata]|uniref:uncharacterized protein LOC143301375 n=1 Tax=Babylonia areolata TaxID=304850 RepID=UPI003FD14FDB
MLRAHTAAGITRVVVLSWVLSTALCQRNDTDDCVPAEALKCTFSRDLCNWHHPGWKWTYAAGRGAAKLLGSRMFGRLTSPVVCPSQGSWHCLNVDYDFQDGRLTVYLNDVSMVGLVFRGSKASGHLETPVVTQRNRAFKLIIDAARDYNDSNRMLVQSIEFKDSPCEDTSAPRPSTTPTTSATSAASATSTASPGSTAPTPALSTSASTTSGTSTTSPNANATSAAETVTSQTSDQSESPEGSSDSSIVLPVAVSSGLLVVIVCGLVGGVLIGLQVQKKRQTSSPDEKGDQSMPGQVPSTSAEEDLDEHHYSEIPDAIASVSAHIPTHVILENARHGYLTPLPERPRVTHDIPENARDGYLTPLPEWPRVTHDIPENARDGYLTPLPERPRVTHDIPGNERDGYLTPLPERPRVTHV